MFYEYLKRLIDIIGTLIALFFAFPIILIFAIFVKFTSNGPIFYTPTRVGKGGKLFKMLKFRSMYMYRINGKMVHARQYLNSNPKLKLEYQKNSFKLANDPRVTPIGKILRRFSIDELPQLINVLKGDMSLVGPRAYQPDELAHQQRVYPKSRKFVKIILTARPGPGKGCLHRISFGRPNSFPKTRTSSLNNSRNGSMSLSRMRAGSPPTL